MEGKSDLPSCSECHEEEEEEDRISKLPDNLIHEIFYFIDVKYAVQTSVLSKRWRNVWTSLPFITLTWAAFTEDKIAFLEDERDNVSFVESIDRLKDSFADFANKVLDFHDGSDIQMIKLGFALFNYTLVETFNRWILAAVNHNVQHLFVDVGYYLNFRYEFPHQLLNCGSLKSLTIMLGDGPFGRYTDVILPKSMSLPQIRTLSLDGISISNLELQRLFASCPLMESVVIQECEIQTDNQRNVIIDSHSLQFCGLINNRHTHLGYADHFVTCSTMISAPNATGFRCTGFMTEDFSLENLSSLVGAHLDMKLRESEANETAETYSELPVEEKEVLAKRMMKVLGAVHNVQHLTLSSGFLEVLSQAPGPLYGQPPQLCNLEILKLEIRFTRGCLRSIAYLLKISPIIRILRLKSKESNLADVGDDWEAGFSSMCMFSHLKFVEIREVEGCDNELKLLRFLFKNSTALEKVNLFFRSASNSLAKERQVNQFTRNLRALPRVSSSIQVGLFTLKMQSRAN